MTIVYRFWSITLGTACSLYLHPTDRPVLATLERGATPLETIHTAPKGLYNL